MYGASNSLVPGTSARASDATQQSISGPLASYPQGDERIFPELLLTHFPHAALLPHASARVINSPRRLTTRHAVPLPVILYTGATGATGLQTCAYASTHVLAAGPAVSRLCPRAGGAPRPFSRLTYRSSPAPIAGLGSSVGCAVLRSGSSTGECACARSLNVVCSHTLSWDEANT